MVIRRIVLVIGVLLIALGLSQVTLTSWWAEVTRSLWDLAKVRAMGIVSLLVGVILAWAGLRRLVGLRQLVLLLGLISILGGLLVTSAPSFAQDVLYAVILNRARWIQLTIIWVSGLVRIGIGAVLVYAALRPDRPSPTETVPQ